MVDVYLSCLPDSEPHIWGYLEDLGKYHRDILRYRTLIWPQELGLINHSNILSSVFLNIPSKLTKDRELAAKNNQNVPIPNLQRSN